MVLKLEVGVPSSKLKKPPKSCIPRRAKMKMNKNSRNRRDKIEDMAFIKAITRFLSEDQYLKERKNKHKNTLKYYYNFYSRWWGFLGQNFCTFYLLILFIEKKTYFVTLKTRRSLKALRADRPKLPALSWKFTQNTSKTDPAMTKVSNRLNDEVKNVIGPKA